MKTLKTQFRKNGLDYTLLKLYKVALFQLGHLPDQEGYEVSRIYIMRPHKAFGVDFEESEIITSNDQFITDGSGSFRDLGDALRHFAKMTDKYVRQDYVDDLSPSDTELIAECQTVGDNAS